MSTHSTTIKYLPVIINFKGLIILGSIITFLGGLFFWYFLKFINIGFLLATMGGIGLFLIFISQPILILEGLIIFLLISATFANFVESAFGFMTKEFLVFLLCLSWLLNSLINGELSLENISFEIKEIMLAVWLSYLLLETARQSPVVGFFGLRSIALYFPLYFIVPSIIDNKTKLRRILRTFLLGIVFIAVIAIIQYLFVSEIMDKFGFSYGELAYRTISGHLKASSTLGDPASSGSLLAMFILFYCSVWFSNREGIKKKGKYIKVSIVILLFFGLIVTFSRISWIGCLIGFLIWSCLFKKQAKRIILIGFSLILIINIYLDNFIYHHFISAFGFGENIRAIKSTQARISIITNVFETYLAENPILGHGLGITGAPSMRNAHLLREGYQVMDNYYLKLLVETGMIGTTIFIIFFGLCIASGIKQFKSLNDPEVAGASLGISLALIILATVSMANSVLESPVINIYFWILLGLLQVCRALDKQEAQKLPLITGN